ncbi:MAG TPA: bifunctional DNA-formamidopyrimidine glycosylase/DNA-(apurinic or apyrimidinic site) lyase [Bryobacteraceae bacterium]|jgi:formamidopyrimidine-DNA glycosylase|nr:bifunctional DNA-formamidopyrimidine glycosylase/DNA-(apurinic or apyrimidinic site) lyase [Bryobacteraceae bacterium]
MPELPEVETIVRGLAPRLAGRRILAAEFRCARVLRGDPARIVGKTIRGVRRHGKYIVMDFSDASASLGIHLGMTGKLLMDAELGVHSHAILTLDRGVLVYDDIRQFGRIELSETFAARLERLGPDPLSLDTPAFASALRDRSAMVKPLLLNQTFLRGMGNIYTDEALHRAGIHPRALGRRLTRVRAERLHEAIREVLLESIDTGGSSVSDYVDSEGRRGSFQLRHRVYGKEGQPCPACGTPIRRILVAQRGTHFCPKCQKR